ncbi:pesticin C-terminus-like muramidase [Pseudomonas saudimassiliensis]|uniref:pesticin C-terminus-like muramidase n=1 Tax=Pseudomonas saudimassiliensis TaxID=1461581 RepID=UPI001EF5A29B|nr:pesticin C-terminus-like muramidase [Pseudomonas saudimassiliensis]
MPKGQLTFDVEGNDDESSIYFSRVAHWPRLGASGITIGRGYDIGHQSNVKSDLESVGITEPLLSWLEGAQGLTRNAARDYLQNASPEIRRHQITRKQQQELFLLAYERMENDVK